jgi:hypothetical protein
MSLGARWLALLAVCWPLHQLQAKPLYILVIGQSIASNCNEHPYTAVSGVYQIGLNGLETPAADPFEWADCKRGSTWIPLGRNIIKAGLADRVTFMPIGVSDATAGDWAPGGKAEAKLSRALALVKQKGIVFDYAFWQQGPADIGTVGPRYTKALNSVIYRIAKNASVKTWLIANHAACHGRSDANIAKVQYYIAKYYHLSIFPGPNTDQLGERYRFDGCNLNQAGQEKIAQGWLDAMVATESTRGKIQKEMLLEYFR